MTHRDPRLPRSQCSGESARRVALHEDQSWRIAREVADQLSPDPLRQLFNTKIPKSQIQLEGRELFNQSSETRVLPSQGHSLRDAPVRESMKHWLHLDRFRPSANDRKDRAARRRVAFRQIFCPCCTAIRCLDAGRAAMESRPSVKNKQDQNTPGASTLSLTPPPQDTYAPSLLVTPPVSLRDRTAPSSSGLGRRPLTAKTRVRVP